MGKLVVVNAPSSFAYIWSVVKFWLSKETIEKVDVQGSNYREALLALIDVENLPVEYGGTCACQGEGGCVFSSAGPWLETREYKKEGEGKEGAEETMKSNGGMSNGQAEPQKIS